MIRQFLEQLLQAVGVQGVSAMALAVLISVALYAHKVSTVGKVALTGGSTILHDLQVVALALAGLLILGAISVDSARVQELIYMAQHGVDWSALLEIAGDTVRSLL